MMRKIAIVAAPLFLLMVLETAFRLGIWEPLAASRSHAATSIRMKRALLDPALARIDFVTLGSSRPQFGIDHARLADAAAAQGFVHANLSMPGSHWMTIGVVSRWLQAHHPEIQGGLIALSAQDLTWKTNGYYELGIVQPFRRGAHGAWIEARNPFDSTRIESYGSRSALFAWRDDVRDFLTHPFSRIANLRNTPDAPDTPALFRNQELTGDMCQWGVQSLDACSRLDSAANGPPRLRQQCGKIREHVGNLPDYPSLIGKEELPLYMQETRDLAQSQLRALDWPVSPIVVLMPMPKIWRDDTRSVLAQEWALRILRPLDDEGVIHLLDATRFFDDAGSDACTYFADFYHQNAKGRERLSRWLLPQVGDMLFGPRASVRPIARAEK